MTTTKKRIFDALKDIEGLSVVYALDYQDDIELPYVRYQLLESNAIYLSNEEHNTRARYQLDLYSLQALDVQGEGNFIDCTFKTPYRASEGHSVARSTLH